MKNQKGVTLIALVVTIIVLIILAGVSIAVLTGDNGVITRSKLARRNQIEGEVRDRVVLAVQAAKLYSEQKSVTDAGWFAGANLNTIITLLQGDLNGMNGTTPKTTPFITVETYAANGQAVGNNNPAVGIHIVYTSSEYQNATNLRAAQIDAWIKITNNNFEFDNTKGEQIAGADTSATSDDVYSGWQYTPAIAD